MNLSLFALLFSAAKSAGVEMTFEVLGDVKAFSRRMLEVGLAQADYELAVKLGMDDAGILGGNLQEQEQRAANLLAMIEQKYPALLADVIKGLIGTVGVKL